jgi:hypothetical protein
MIFKYNMILKRRARPEFKFTLLTAQNTSVQLFQVQHFLSLINSNSDYPESSIFNGERPLARDKFKDFFVGTLKLVKLLNKASSCKLKGFIIYKRKHFQLRLEVFQIVSSIIQALLPIDNLSFTSVSPRRLGLFVDLG